MDEKLSAERVLAIRDAIGLGHVLSTEAAYELLAHIAALEAELGKAKGALLLSIAETHKAEADKQIAVEALREIKNWRALGSTWDSYSDVKKIARQALSRIEEP